LDVFLPFGSGPSCVEVILRATWLLYTTRVRCHTLRDRFMKTNVHILAFGLAFLLPPPGFASDKPAAPPEKFFRLADMFDLETASDPQISPDGAKVVFVRNFNDIMKDKKRSILWIVGFDGNDLRPLTSGSANDFSPRWSPDGKRLLFASSAEGSVQIYVRWLDTGQTAKVTSVQKSPTSMSWSPDGKWIAFAMLVPEETKPFAEMPAKPESAEWAKPAKVIQKLLYRADGEGYLEDGYSQVFVVTADGGTPRQLTHGAFNNAGPLSWTPDGRSIVFSANRHDDWEYDPLNSEIYEVSLAEGTIHALTERKGPDQSPTVSPDGRFIAYTGFDDKEQGYQVTRLYVMNRDGTNARLISGGLDRDVEEPKWSQDGGGLYFQYDDQGNTKIGLITLDGKLR
jgi:Tol biopolymer transport system component